MRLWNEDPGRLVPIHARDYETIGLVLSGRAELTIAGEQVQLVPGDCWRVPRGVGHRYRVLERFEAVEATAPPAEVGGRDEPVRHMNR